MEAIAALGLASNIIQIVDFSSRILSRGHEIYSSADGSTAEHALLSDTTKNLSELHESLNISDDADGYNKRKLNVADKQLIKLKTESQQIATDLQTALDKVKLSNKDKKWRSVRHALLTIRSDKEISVLAARLDKIRQQVDSAAMISILASLERRPLVAERTPMDEVRTRKTELLSNISGHDWRAQSQQDVNAFAQHLDSLAIAEVETRFRKMILAQLYFQHMPTRAENIPSAHRETLQWLLDDDSQLQDQRKWASLSSWLQEEDNNIYWVTGKPGSGKSTLMKFLYHHASLPVFLDKWAGTKKLSMAGFYFWNSGSTIQMSRLGLLRALLHKLFSLDESLILSVMHERWEAFRTYGGGYEPPDEAELQRAFDRVISDESKRFFFLIDGLDEFEGEPKEIIRFVLGAVRSNVKLCVASRPWLAFEDAFQQRPSLLLENLTAKDISNFVTARFHGNQHFLRLQSLEPEAASRITGDVIRKASGVFLWVSLVVESLLEGLQDSDRITDLQIRLDSLPEGLEALFDKLLDRLAPEHFRQACETFRLLRTYHEIARGDAGAEPFLLELYLADDLDTRSGLNAPLQILGIDAASQRSEAMRRRLIARCRGFIEVRNGPQSQLDEMKVGYLHRTARDFIESDSYWTVVLQHTDRDEFKPDELWANALMWLFKAYPFAMVHTKEYAQKFVSSVDMIQKRTGIVQKARLDELYRIRHKGVEQQYIYENDLLAFKLDSASTEKSLHDYVALALAEAADRGAWDGKLHGMGHHVVKGDIVHTVVSYYRTPRALRRFRPKPVLPKCE